MLEKEAFALLTKRVWCMLDDNTPIADAVTEALTSREPLLFREAVARRVLQSMTDEMGYTYVPAITETNEAFVDAIAFAVAFSACDERPSEYPQYSPRNFAEAIIRCFCDAYVRLANCTADDATLTQFPVECQIPRTAREILELRNRIRATNVSTFGAYCMPPQPRHPSFP